ncbi:MAG: hypothetical protein ABIR70_02740 [Bryobacteraceae bacterium]
MAFTAPLKLGLTAFMLSAFALPTAAVADCAAPLAALAKSWQQPRLAQYEMDKPEQPLPKQAAMIRIGKTIWNDLIGSGRFTRFDDGPSEDTFTLSMKRQATKGPLNCELLGNATYRGQPVVKYKLDPSTGTNTLGRVTLWVSKTSGLAVYQEYEKGGGYAWVYGDAVKEPTGK